MERGLCVDAEVENGEGKHSEENDNGESVHVGPAKVLQDVSGLLDTGLVLRVRCSVADGLPTL